MANRTRKVEQSPKTDRMLQEKEINDLFDALKLSTFADREKFLRLERLSNYADVEQDRAKERFRVLFGDSTASDPSLK